MPAHRRLRRILPGFVALFLTVGLTACSADSTSPVGPAGPQPEEAPTTWGETHPVELCEGEPLAAIGENRHLDDVQEHTDEVIACLVSVEESTVPEHAHEWQVGQESVEVTITLQNPGRSQIALPYGPPGLLRFGGDQPVEPVTRGGRPEIPERLTGGQGFTATFIFMVPGEPREDFVINYGPFSWWSIPDRTDPRAHDPQAKPAPTP